MKRWSLPLPGTTVTGGDEVILLVDDEASLRDLGQEILTRFGYQVLPASSGEEALDIYRQAGKNRSGNSGRQHARHGGR